MKKYSKKKKWIAAGLSVVLIGGTACGVFLHGRNRSFKAMSKNVTAQSAVVEKGDISTTVVGTGNLESADAQDLTIPSGLKVEKVFVKSGDSVKKGDTLATVDADSVKQAMLEAQEEINELDEDMEEAKDDEASSYISAGVSGTIKKIYAKTEKEVSSIMAKKGALMIIVLDDESETEISVIGVQGTISKIYVSEGDTVSAGDHLIYLENAGETSEYRELVAQRQEMTEYMQQLSEISAANKIVASFDGIIQSVNVEAGSSASAVSSTQSGVSAVRTSAVVSSAKKSSANESVVLRAAAKAQVCSATVKTASEAETEAQTEKESETSASTQKVSIGSLKELVNTPVIGGQAQTEIAETDYYTGKIVWENVNGTFAADTVYMAKVTLYAKSSEDISYVFPENLDISQSKAVVSGVTVTEKEVQFTLTFEKLVQPSNENSGQKETEATSGNSQNNGNANVPNTNNAQNQNQTNQKNNTGNNSGQNTGNKTQSTPTASGSISVSGGGSVSGGVSTASTSTTSSSSTQSETSNNSVTAFTISPDETMNLSISVDELDILSIAEGQSAEITFDALEEKSFTGTVSSISGTASVNGGVAKYTVEIEIPKDEDMRIGMNASATIKVQDKQDILLIPSAALQEKGDSTFVYTSQSEDGTLGDEVEVEIGLSDGSNVEIVSGLSEGDTVYYTRTAGDSSEDAFGGFGGFGGDMPGGKDMSGKDMPDMKGGGNRGGNGDMTPPNQ